MKIVYLAQVLNFEDEIVRATDINKAIELTKSKSTSNFKTDFCKLKVPECRELLKRHNFDVSKLWTKKVPKAFNFIESNSSCVKVNLARKD